MKRKKKEVVQILRRGYWYKRHFKERMRKVFEILDGDTLLGDD